MLAGREIGLFVVFWLVVGVLAGCGGGHVDCDGDRVWESLQAEVVEVGEARTTDSDPTATVTIRAAGGLDREVQVWGNPLGLDVGSTYAFEIDQHDQAFFEFGASSACGPILQTELIGAS